jgi:predicted transcriptional regulator
MLHQIFLALTNMHSNKEYLTISSVLRRSRLRFHKRQKKFLLALLCVFLLYKNTNGLSNSLGRLQHFQLHQIL